MKNKMFREKRQYAFRQWSRRPYAVFNSLKMLIKISVLSAVYTLVNPVQECKAQTDSVEVSKKVDLEEVEVSGQRSPVLFSQVARTLSVISRSEVDRAPAISVNELLESIPQVDIRQRGVNGVQADISIQGGSFDQTLILLNGINFSDPQTGHHNLNLPIDIESIDRIDVLKGPSSRVYGTNAFSGAVNFITGENTRNSVSFKAMGGSYGTYRTSMAANINHKGFNNFFSMSKSASDGYIEKNTDYDIVNFYNKTKYSFGNNDVNLQIGASLKDFGALTFYSPYSSEQFESTKTYLGSLGGNIRKGTVTITPNVFWRRNYDHYIYIRSNPAYYQNFHYTDVYGASLNTTINSEMGKTSIGAEYRKEVMFSTRLGNIMDSSDFKSVAGENNIYYTKRDARENISLFVEQNMQVSNLFLTIGVMANSNTKLNGIEVYPGIDCGYEFYKGLKAYSSINRSLRLPTFTDLYYNGPRNIGNPYLKPEQAWTAELGLKYHSQEIDAQAAYFYRKAEDVIDWIWVDSLNAWHTENLTQLNTQGFEASITLNKNFWENLVPFIDFVRFSYAYTTINKSSEDKKSNYALDNLKHKISIDFAHQIYGNLGMNWKFSYQDRNGGYLKWNGTGLDATETPYDPFMLVDVKMYYRAKNYSVFFDCNNLLDKSYIDLGNVPQPGITFRAGAEINLGLQ